MKTCVVTCGPSSEPIDAVRRLTNFSTGELGVILAETLVKNGARVICCKGSGATWPDPAGCELFRFTTNADLQDLLEKLAEQEKVDAVFHTAALTDFAVKDVTDENGKLLTAGKLSSALPGLIIRLVPASKVLPLLRSLFSQAKIIGWKYEVNGTPLDVIERGRQQIQNNNTDGCVINGPAYGNGFGMLQSESLKHFPDKPALAEFLSSDAVLDAT